MLGWIQIVAYLQAYLQCSRVEKDLVVERLQLKARVPYPRVRMTTCSGNVGLDRVSV